MNFFSKDNLDDNPNDMFLLPLGQTGNGDLLLADFFELEHILIGGDTDKTQPYLKFIIRSLSDKYSPKELQLIINTHDKSQFFEFENLPHLFSGKINSTTPEILEDAQKLYRIYRDRHDLLESANTDFFKYNKSNIEKELPLIVSITHDYSLLQSLEDCHMICNLANKAFYAKNTGVFLIISASNYADISHSKEVFDACFPTRMAFLKKIRTRQNCVLIQSKVDKFLSENRLIFQHITKRQQQTIKELKLPNYDK